MRTLYMERLDRTGLPVFVIRHDGLVNLNTIRLIPDGSGNEAEPNGQSEGALLRHMITQVAIHPEKERKKCRRSRLTDPYSTCR